VNASGLDKDVSMWRCRERAGNVGLLVYGCQRISVWRKTCQPRRDCPGPLCPLL